MAKKLFTLLLAIVAGVISISGAEVEYDFVENGIYYKKLTESTVAVHYKNYSKSKGYNIAYGSPNTITDAIIPAVVQYSGVQYDVVAISSHAFESCSGLTSVTIPNSVTRIGDWAFAYCESLTSVTIPNSVTSIGEYAFCDCVRLTSVIIPNSVTRIGNYAFYYCNGLTSLSVEAGNTVYDSRNNCNAIIWTSTNTLIFGCQNTTIPNSVTSIGEGAFRECRTLTSVTIPNSVISIGYQAFYNCTGLTSVTIGNSVTSIGDRAFEGCESLTSVTIPNSVTVIGSYAFGWCTGLTSVTIGNSVTSIGDYAFSGCTGLTSVTIPNSVTSIGERAFRGCTGLTDIYVTCGDLERVQQMFDYDDRVKYKPLPYSITINATNGNVDVPPCIDDGTMEITANPDYGYHFTQWSDGVKDNPRTIVLTQDTTFTAEFAIDRTGSCGDNNALIWTYDAETKTLTITGNGTLNSNYYFGIEAPTQMQKLVIGNEVTSIGDSAFYEMSSINHLIIGGSVATIGNYAFAECRNFDDITCYATTVPIINETTFANVGNKQYIYLFVPAERERAYYRDTYWGEFDIQVQQAEETTVTTNDVTVEPQDNAATVTWPTNDNAASYTIVITKDGVLFCTLTFNANGQLTGIAFAPSRDGQAHAPAAVMTANGLQFTVTGLNSNTQYGYNLIVKDANDQTVATYSGEFTTTGESQGFENVQGNNVQCTKVVRNGQIFILRGDKTYTTDGRLVR